MTFNHLDDLSVSAYFSDCGNFRYRMDIVDRNSKGSKTICVVMQNPSEADTVKADKSVQFLERLVFKTDCEVLEGVSRMIIVNQFAFIQKKGFKGFKEHVGDDNDRIIRESVLESDIVLIAWGKINPFPKRKEAIFQIVADCGNKILLETKKHPSRGFYKDFIQPILVPQDS